MGVRLRIRIALVLVLTLVAATACNRQDDRPAPSPTQSPPAAPASPSTPGKTGPPRLVKLGDFSQPVFVTSPAGDPRLFVVEKTGAIKIVQTDGAAAGTFLDISADVSTGYEQGLLSMAFAPDYAQSGAFYINYTDTEGDTRIVEFKVSTDPNKADTGSRRELLKIDQPYSNHNGGLVMFDPEGNLVIGMGDGGSGGDPENRAQNLNELLGKLLRIDPKRPTDGKPYGIPQSNPFVGGRGGAPEIWAYGLRNPWRFSFDARRTLYLGDVGQNRFEEVNVVPWDAIPGANFGWRAYEGSERATREQIDESKLVKPVHTYSLSGVSCAVAGGYVYRGSVEGLRGRYLYADNCEGLVRSFRVEAGAAADHQQHDALKAPSISSFGEDTSGELYVTSLSGEVFRIDADA